MPEFIIVCEVHYLVSNMRIVITAQGQWQPYSLPVAHWSRNTWNGRGGGGGGKHTYIHKFYSEMDFNKSFTVWKH